MADALFLANKQREEELQNMEDDEDNTNAEGQQTVSKSGKSKGYAQLDSRI